MWWDGGNWIWMGLMMLVMLVFWGGVIALIAWAIIRFTRREIPRDTVTGSHGPLDIAKERYARGEITRDQYEQIKRDLT